MLIGMYFSTSVSVNTEWPGVADMNGFSNADLSLGIFFHLVSRFNRSESIKLFNSPMIFN